MVTGGPYLITLHIKGSIIESQLGVYLYVPSHDMNQKKLRAGTNLRHGGQKNCVPVEPITIVMIRCSRRFHQALKSLLKHLRYSPWI